MGMGVAIRVDGGVDGSVDIAVDIAVAMGVDIGVDICVNTCTSKHIKRFDVGQRTPRQSFDVFDVRWFDVHQRHIKEHQTHQTLTGTRVV